MTRDLRDAWRQLRRRPILTLVAVLTLAIGTGANTAFFSLLNALLLRPLRVPAASQLVSVTESEPNGSQHGLTPRMVQALADRQSSLAAMSGYAGGGPVRITVESEEFSGGWEIGGPGFLETLGLRPEIGRFLEPADEGHPVVVVTDRFWRRRLSGDPAVLGRRISLEGTPVSIVGVAPESYEGLQLENRADVVLLPSSYNLIEGTPSEPVLFSVLGRLRDDATIATARANFSAIWPGVIADALPPDVSSSQRAAYLTRRLDVDSARNGFSFLRTRYAGSLTLLVGLTLVDARDRRRQSGRHAARRRRGARGGVPRACRARRVTERPGPPDARGRRVAHVAGHAGRTAVRDSRDTSPAHAVLADRRSTADLAGARLAGPGTLGRDPRGSEPRRRTGSRLAGQPAWGCGGQREHSHGRAVDVAMGARPPGRRDCALARPARRRGSLHPNAGQSSADADGLRPTRRPGGEPVAASRPASGSERPPPRTRARREPHRGAGHCRRRLHQSRIDDGRG